MGPLLPRRNKLIYPGGQPGFNPLHKASGPQLRYSAVAMGGSYVNLLTGAGATVHGTPAKSIDPIIGPVMTCATSGQYFTTPGFAETPTGVIFAAILTPYSTSTSFGNVIIAGNFTTALGIVLDSDNIKLWNNGNGGTGLSSFAYLPNHPYFVAHSMYNSTSTNLVQATVIVDLLTGAVQYGTATGTTTLNGFTSAIYAIGGASGGFQANAGIAAVMYSAGTLTPAELREWGNDPWSFWYPQQGRQTIFSSLANVVAPFVPNGNGNGKGNGGGNGNGKISAPGQLKQLWGPTSALDGGLTLARYGTRAHKRLSAAALTQPLIQASTSQALSGVTQSATAALPDNVLAAQSLAAATQSATASAGAGAAASQTLAAVTQSAAASVAIQASALQALAGAIQSAAATVPDNAATFQQLGGVAQTAGSSVQIAAGATQSLAAVSQAATLGDPNAAIAAESLAGVAQSAAASIIVHASAARALDNVVSFASAQALIQGSAATPLDDVTSLDAATVIISASGVNVLADAGQTGAIAIVPFVARAIELSGVLARSYAVSGVVARSATVAGLIERTKTILGLLLPKD